MELINKVIKFVQDNWIAFVLLAGALVLFLNAFSKAIVNWAKATPDESDDKEAEIEAAKINVIVQFFKDLFKLKD